MLLLTSSRHLCVRQCRYLLSSLTELTSWILWQFSDEWLVTRRQNQVGNFRRCLSTCVSVNVSVMEVIDVRVVWFAVIVNSVYLSLFMLPQEFWNRLWSLASDEVWFNFGWNVNIFILITFVALFQECWMIKFHLTPWNSVKWKEQPCSDCFKILFWEISTIKFFNFC